MDTSPFISAIESELHKQVSRLDLPATHSFHEMLTYHLGWSGDGAGSEARGKRIRPLLVLLSCAACGGEWLRATAAAAAVELVHNFSLVHDDIQDASETRRGRLTVWARWGAPNAINVGDALFVLAQQSMLDLQKDHPPTIVTGAINLINNSCLELTCGQYLDMTYEGRAGLLLEDYWRMIRGKTAALLAASCHIGALLGGADDNKQDAFRSFGESLGLAFQVQDDILGVWGDENVTGKSAASDLLEGKNSLPVLYGLSKNGAFSELWNRGPIQTSDVDSAKELLKREGALDFARRQAEEFTTRAMERLKSAEPQGEAGRILNELAIRLIKREQ